MPYGQPIITEDYVLCEECGKQFSKLTPPHIKKHGMTIPEYKEKWGFCKKQPLEAFYIKKIRQENNLKYGSTLNLTNNPNFEKNKFRKGEPRNTGIRVITEQERLHLNSIAINVHSTDEFKKTISEASKKVWLRPGYKDAYREMSKKLCDNDETRKRFSEQAKEFWSDPKRKEEHSKKISAGWSTPEMKKYASERSLANWKKIKEGKICIK